MFHVEHLKRPYDPLVSRETSPIPYFSTVLAAHSDPNHPHQLFGGTKPQRPETVEGPSVGVFFRRLRHHQNPTLAEERASFLGGVQRGSEPSCDHCRICTRSLQIPGEEIGVASDDLDPVLEPHPCHGHAQGVHPGLAPIQQRQSKVRSGLGDDQPRDPGPGPDVEYTTCDPLESRDELSGMVDHLFDGPISQRAQALRNRENLGESSTRSNHEPRLIRGLRCREPAIWRALYGHLVR